MTQEKAQKKASYHHGDLARALVVESAALLEAEGPDALSLRAVARRLGVSHAAPAHHFADKAALLDAVATEGFRELTARMRDAWDDAGSDPRRRLEAAGVAYVRFAADRPATFRVMFGQQQSERSTAHDAAAREAHDVLVTAARAVLTARGELTPERLTLVITTAWSLVHGLAHLWIDGRLGHVADGTDALTALARRVTELVGAALDMG